MVTIGGLLASAVVKMAGDKLGFVIAEQASLVWNARKHMVDMKDTLETIGATLQDAEKRSISEASVRLWLKRLRNAAYDISDMLDEFQETSRQTPQKMTGILPIAVRKISQANKMKRMREKLRKIEAQHTSFRFVQSTIAVIDQQAYDPRETTSHMNESDIIGRDAERTELKDLLSVCHDKSEQTTIIPIYGLGGIGKTTLAGRIYNDKEFIKKYDYLAWVYASQEFNLKKIGRSIVLQLPTYGQQNTDTLELVNRCLDDLLRGKKALIVLDDIWEEDDSELDKLKTMLHKRDSMIDVIVTTRNEVIANKICTKKPYKLQPLKDDLCWDIIKRSSKFEDNAKKEQLERIGLDIAKKCGGVALAAQALGYMLKSKDLNGWSEVNESDIWKKSFEDDNLVYNNVLPSLKLSFEKMPPSLRLCFSYSAIFPKGHDIVEDYLIYQWIALNFIKPSEGKEYIKQLLGMSFLQHSKLPSISGETVVRYTMHDLVHDLARSVICDELIVVDPERETNLSGLKFYRYALIKNYDGKTKLSNILPQQIKALKLSESSKLDLRAASFCFAKCLRILDFSGRSSTPFPKSLGQLKQLRCLIAPRMQNKMLPDCFTELTKLQYLNLHDSPQISALPESVGKLGCLMYLGLTGCSGISKLPESFGDLKCMVRLDMSGCSGITKLPESFGSLKNLVHLDMSSCSGIIKLPGSLGNLANLQHLELSKCSALKVVPESLCGLTKLQYLNLSSCDYLVRLPEEIGRLVNLQYLSMAYCDRIRELPESFEKLRNLLHLDLRWCHIEKGLPRALRGLSALEYLVMPGYDFLIGLGRFSIDGQELSDALGSLSHLKILKFSPHTMELFGEGHRYLASNGYIGWN